MPSRNKLESVRKEMSKIEKHVGKDEIDRRLAAIVGREPHACKGQIGVSPAFLRF